jgi:hypothetical protein
MNHHKPLVVLKSTALLKRASAIVGFVTKFDLSCGGLLRIKSFAPCINRRERIGPRPFNIATRGHVEAFQEMLTLFCWSV